MLYTLGQWREIVAYFRQRHARYGAIATVGVIVALAIAVAVNVASRQNKRWDFTASRQNSLAEQTVKVVQSLDAPVKFTVFDKQTEFERFRPRLEAYTTRHRGSRSMHRPRHESRWRRRTPASSSTARWS